MHKILNIKKETMADKNDNPGNIFDVGGAIKSGLSMVKKLGTAALPGIKKEVGTYAKNITAGVSAVNKWNPWAPQPYKSSALSAPADSGKVGTQRERPTFGGGAVSGAASAGKASASYGNVAKKAVGAASAKAIPSSNKVSGKVATAGAKGGASKAKTAAKPSKPTKVEIRPIATISATKTPSNERMQEVVSKALDTTQKVVPTRKESRQEARSVKQRGRQGRKTQRLEGRLAKVKGKTATATAVGTPEARLSPEEASKTLSKIGKKQFGL